MAIAFYGDGSSCHDVTVSTFGRVVAPEPSSLKGLEDVRVQEYNGLKGFRRVISTASRKLVKHLSTQQYLVFSHVKQEDLDMIDQVRVDIERSMKFTYYSTEELLIIKLIPSAEHEYAHKGLETRLYHKVFVSMRMSPNEFTSVGSKRCRGSDSSKEPDSCFLPLGVRNALMGWPTLVFETGFSESLRRLRVEASWWLTNSGGEVKIVILVSLERTRKFITIEKWGLVKYAEELTSPLTRHLHQNPEQPQKIQQLIVQEDTVTGARTVTGAPLVLEFSKIFLREPVPPERDVEYTEQELLEWDSHLWP